MKQIIKGTSSNSGASLSDSEFIGKIYSFINLYRRSRRYAERRPMAFSGGHCPGRAVAEKKPVLYNPLWFHQ